MPRAASATATAVKPHRTFRFTDAHLGVVLVLPVILYLLIVEAYPFFWALYLSLTDKAIGMPATFVGLANYVKLAQDPLFWKTVSNSVVFTFFSILFKLVFGMIMALVLHQAIFGRNILRALLFLPWTIPTLVTTLGWQWMFSDVGGVLNYIFLKVGLIRYPVGWLSTPGMAMFSIILVNVWRGTPFFGISLLSALQTIPQELYEAAEVDGATAWQRFWKITVPSLMPVILLVTLVSTIWTLNDFQHIWLLTRGGPSNGTQVFSTLSYTVGFLNMHLGEAIAISAFTLPVMLLLVWVITRRVLSQV